MRKRTPDTIKEVTRQPELWLDTARRMARLQPELVAILSRLDILATNGVPSGVIILSGAGTSYFIGKSVESALQNNLRIRVLSVPTTELTLFGRKIFLEQEKALHITFSRSGESPESLRAVEIALEFPNVFNLIITCNTHGALAKTYNKQPNVKVIALDKKTCDKGLAMTASATSMMIAGLFLSWVSFEKRYLDGVGKLALAAKEIINNADILSQQSRGNSNTLNRMLRAIDIPKRFAVVGSGARYGAALESALKITEMTDGAVSAIAETPLGIRHGPLSFVDSDTVVLFFLSSEEQIRRYEMDTIRQIVSHRIARRIVVTGCDIPNEIRKLGCLDVEFAGQIDDDFRAPIDVLIGQLVALNLSMRLGLDVDNPSKRGVISRVVKGVKIYPLEAKEKPNAIVEELYRPSPRLKMLLTDYEPRSSLITKESYVKQARFPCIDIHNHIDNIDPKELVEIMDACNIQKIVNYATVTGREAEESIKRFMKYARERFEFFLSIDWSKTADSNFIRKTLDYLDRMYDLGARGLKIYKNLGISVKLPDGSRLPIDHEFLEPIWYKAESLNIPVVIHTSDPLAFFSPPDRFNERYVELATHPEWSLYNRGLPSHEQLLAERDRVFARHRKLRFVALHFGGFPENLSYVRDLLDKNPNVWIDISGRVAELGRQPYKARETIMKYPDRVCFGTDLLPGVEMYRRHFRFLETKDEYFDYPTFSSRQGGWKIYGLHLPDKVLKQVYFDNAIRILGGAK